MPDNEQPTIFVLFGGTGDLAKRMVLPAFYQLFTDGLLPKQWRLVGNGRGDVSHEDFREHVFDSLTEFGPKPSREEYAPFGDNVRFAGGGFDTDDPGSLLDVIADTEKEIGSEYDLVHYCAVPPVAFVELTKAFDEHNLAKGAKVVYEKPYGTSPEKFRELDELVHSVFDESQVYRIDHFLGKESTQNLAIARFGNRMFGDLWHRDHIAQVQIDVPETLDIADRAGFYDATGAALDMLVTHLFQVAAEVAMEPPVSFRADDLQEARESVISAFRPLDPADTVLGQFATYRATEGIADDSTTDTFVATKLWVDTDRWEGVPFLLRTGKMLAGGAQQVSLVLKSPDGPLTDLAANSNVITFDLKGNGALHLRMVTKKPGPDLVPAEGCTTLDLQNVAPGSLAPYTALLHDVLVGDRSQFTSSDGLAATWRAFQPLLGPDRPAPITYEDGSWGPKQAEALTGDVGWIVQAE